MTWAYKQSTGELTSPEGKISQGYSGFGEGENNPKMQNISKKGPIPTGLYTIGPAYHDPEKGPCVMHLIPNQDNQMFGRSGFLMHGDNSKANDSASEGCIIMGPVTRRKVSESDDRDLNVIS